MTVQLVLQDIFRQQLFWFCGNRALPNPNPMRLGQKTKIKPRKKQLLVLVIHYR